MVLVQVWEVLKYVYRVRSEFLPTDVCFFCNLKYKEVLFHSTMEDLSLCKLRYLDHLRFRCAQCAMQSAEVLLQVLVINT